MLKSKLVRATCLFGIMWAVASVAAARDWDWYYQHRPNFQGDFTNREAWSATIVYLGPDWFEVVRYGEVIRIRLVEGRVRLFVGQRVRMVPFARDDEAEIAELRLPDQDFRPVGVVRYIERRVPKDRPWHPAPAVEYRFGIYVGPRSVPKCDPPDRGFRPPPVRRNGHWVSPK